MTETPPPLPAWVSTPEEEKRDVEPSLFSDEEAELNKLGVTGALQPVGESFVLERGPQRAVDARSP